MRRQLALVIFFAPVVGLLSPGTSRAHRLEAECRVLPGKRVQVESWYETGDSARHARVQVFRPDGQTLATGRMDAKGIFVFPFTEVEPLKVVVSAGAGHRVEVTVRAEDLAKPAPAPVDTNPETRGDNPPDPPAPIPLADRSSRLSVKDVLVGITFLLAVAAFFLSWRNARELRDLRRPKGEPTGEPR